MKIILASKSDRRKQLLRLLNFNFTTISADINESNYLKNVISPEKFCSKLASVKAHRISIDHPNSIVIGGDTIVVINNEILGKPKDKNNAFEMLTKLKDKKHAVLTGISIQCKAKNISHTFYDKTVVTFNNYSDEEIYYYINNFHPFDKAGSYGIQDWSSIFVKKIDGCFYNVVGFPISKFYTNFKELGLNKLIKTF